MLKLLYITFDEMEYGGFSGSYSYTAQFGLAEGFQRYCEIDYAVILKSPQKGRQQELQKILANALKGRQYDIVYCPLCHVRNVPEFYEVLKQIAPIRVAVLSESLNAQITVEVKISDLITTIETSFTHVLVYDEIDAEYFRIPVMFCPTSIPDDLIVEKIKDEKIAHIVFFGEVRTRERYEQLNIVSSMGMLDRPKRPENGTVYIPRYNMANSRFLLDLTNGKNSLERFHEHGKELMSIRREIFKCYMNRLNEYVASISPHTLFGSFPGRVFESMASGTAVLCFNPPVNRNKTLGLFEHGKEIFLYGKDLRQNLQEFMKISLREMSIRALQKIREKHTVSIRVDEIMRFIGKRDI